MQDRQAECLEMLRSGLTQRQIMAKLNAPRSSVSRWCRQAVLASGTLSDRKPLRTRGKSLAATLFEYMGVNTVDCIEWKGFIKPNGYGSFRFGNETDQAHRAVYKCFVGEIPDGMQIDHICNNRKCVNPHHLQIVNGPENVYFAHIMAERNL